MDKQKIKIYFRADAGDRIGYGHFIRSLALADILKNDFDCTFFTQTPTDFQKREARKVCKLVELPADETKFDLFLTTIRGDEIVILDNYFFTSEYQRILKNEGCKLICFGTNDKHYYADVIINYVLSENDFSAENYTKFCLGFEWMLLREPFFCMVHRKNNILDEKKNVVICFGGTDQFELTEKAVSVLKRMPVISDIHVISTNVIGALRIDHLCSQNVNMHINISAQEVADIFSQCDIAIVSASSIAQEALACHIPVIAGYYLDNQQNLYNYLLKNQYIMGVGDLMNEDFTKHLSETLNHFILNGFEVQTFDCNRLRNNYIHLLSTL